MLAVAERCVTRKDSDRSENRRKLTPPRVSVSPAHVRGRQAYQRAGRTRQGEVMTICCRLANWLEGKGLPEWMWEWLHDMKLVSKRYNNYHAPYDEIWACCHPGCGRRMVR